MFEKLEDIEKRYNEITEKISDNEVISNQEEWKKYMKEHSDMQDIVEKYREYKKIKNDMEQAEEMLQDSELKEMAQAEIDECREKMPKIEEELKELLLPKDKDDDKNVIVEIRSGAGGDEAALFAYELFRMYTMYAERNRWKTEVLDINETGLGGIKEVSFRVVGKGVYSKLKFESGVHRVQRVPETETNGRIHTSTVTVAVLPEVDDVEIEINTSDLQVDTYRASGAGGQHVNKTESAVRITHKPTGFVVSCQTERSQIQNRETCMSMLRSKLYDYMKSEQDKKLANERKLQVGTGDRSEKIRTYNFPQGRITDHRIGLSVFQIENFMNGDIEEMVEVLLRFDKAERLKMGE